jgi:hypothetical protein
MIFSEAIEVLTQVLDLPSLERNASGRFVVAFEEGITLELSQGANEGELLLWGKIAPFSNATSKDDLVKLLQLNGPAIKYHDEVLTIDREEKALVLQRLLKLKYIHDEILIREVEGFVNNLEFWVNLTTKDASSPESSTPYMILP